MRSQHGWTNGLASADSANRSVVPLNAVACGIGLVLWTKPNSAEMRMVSPEFLQYLVSGYASWYAKRHRRPGHLTQGRFKAALVQDERYFWTVIRYVHLNPVRGKRPLAAHPADWPWSSYPGYARRQDRVGWVAYEAWQGEMGGSHPEAAYRRFVEEGLGGHGGMALRQR